MDDPSLATVNEAERQRAIEQALPRLRRGEAELQRLAQEAAQVAGTIFGAVSIIDRMRQWLVSPFGPIRDVPRALSICAHTIHRPGEPMVVPDTARDPRFAGSAMVTAPPFIRFYVGFPLVDRAGYAVGALCVADNAPRDTLPDLYRLAALAREAERIVAC